MEAITVKLFKSTDAEESYALCVNGDTRDSWRAQRGAGANFEEVWTVEVQSAVRPELHEVDWDMVLERVIEACDLNDPVLANYEWPKRVAA